jgi:hypothetical protein
VLATALGGFGCCGMVGWLFSGRLGPLPRQRAFAGALDLIASLGGGTVEGYPEAAGSVPAGFLYNGALSTRDRKIGKHCWVVTKVVEPRPWKAQSDADSAS